LHDRRKERKHGQGGHLSNLCTVIDSATTGGFVIHVPSLSSLLSKRANSIVLHNSSLVVCGVISDQPGLMVNMADLLAGAGYWCGRSTEALGEGIGDCEGVAVVGEQNVEVVYAQAWEW